MMKWSVLVVALVCLMASATAVNVHNLRDKIQARGKVTPIYTVSDAAKAGSHVGGIVGHKAGADAGREAGKNAGQQAAILALNMLHAKGVATRQVSSVDKYMANSNVTTAEWAAFAKKNPGAVAFFRAFDANHDNKWSFKEFTNAIEMAKMRGYLPQSFSHVAEWSKLTKDNKNNLNLRTFIAWASKTPAHAPAAVKKPSTAPASAKLPPPPHCQEVFAKFDADHNGVLSLSEFKNAVSGSIAADNIKDKWYTLPRNGPHGTLDLKVWTDFCAAIKGFPRGPADAAKKLDACTPNPCASGTVCQNAPKKCNGTAVCPQFRCVQAGAKPRVQGRAYDNCVHTYKAFDANQDKQLSEVEFVRGVDAARKKHSMWKINTRRSWAGLHKLPNGRVNINSFIHLCVSITQFSGNSGGTAREECWDVFSHFDNNNNMVLSKTEFSVGMQNAKNYGRISPQLNPDKVWNTLPKPTGGVTPGVFIVWCELVSKGVPPLAAAADTLSPNNVKMPIVPTVGPKVLKVIPVVKSSNATKNATATSKKANVTVPVTKVVKIGNKTQTVIVREKPTLSVYQAAKDAVKLALEKQAVANAKNKSANAALYCQALFVKADVNSNRLLTMDEFHGICEDFASSAVCKEYTKVFMIFDASKDGQLSSGEFIKACVAKGHVPTPPKFTNQQLRDAAANAGSMAGKAAGTEAGKKAGEHHGRLAGARTVV